MTNQLFHRLLGSWIKAWNESPPQSDSPLSNTLDAPPVYAVGDIHGRLDLLRELEAAIRNDIKAQAWHGTVLVCLGDYIDRGADSRGVIGHLAERTPICAEEIFLRGNHEQVLLDFLQDAAALESWANFGGLETLRSYGLRPRLPLTPASSEALRQELTAALPASHLAFLNATRLSFETSSHYFVHAGINPRASLAQQKANDLLWIREPFLHSERQFEKIIVHGHTPVAAAEIHANRINVDTGAYATGRLTCAVIAGGQCRLLSTGK